MEIIQAKKRFFKTKEDYLLFRNKFRQAANNKELDSAKYYLLLNILTDRDFKKGFTAISNKRKLSNGFLPFSSLAEAFNRLRSELRLPRKDFFGLPEEVQIDLYSYLKDLAIYIQGLKYGTV